MKDRTARAVGNAGTAEENGRRGCPSCGPRGRVETYRVAVVSAASWPALLLWTLVVTAAGSLLDLPGPAACAATLLGLVPLAVRLRERSWCERCGIDFGRGEGADRDL